MQNYNNKRKEYVIGLQEKLFTKKFMVFAVPFMFAYGLTLGALIN